MPAHQRPVLPRPRPEDTGLRAPGPGGEGGNVSARLAATFGSTGLLAAALLLSATLIALSTAALH